MVDTLQIDVKKIGPCRQQVRVVVPATRVRQEIEDGIRSAGQHIRIPGFRAGKVPRKIVEQRFGPAIRNEVKMELFRDTFREALTSKKLSPLGDPQIQLDQMALSEEKPFEYEVEIDVKPEISLKDYKGIEVKAKKVSVSAKDLDEQVKALRRSRRRPEAHDDEKITEENFAISSVDFTLDGESILKRDAIRISAAAHVVGTDPKAFAKAVTGKKKGNAVKLEVTFPHDFEVEGARGKKGQVALELSKVYRLIEPTDEEMLKDFDFGDMDEMKAEVKKNLLKHKEEEEHRRVEQEILDKITDANKFDLPERLVQEQSQGALARFRQLKQAEGLGEKDLEKAVQGKTKEIEKNSVRQVKGFFLIDAIAKKEKFFITEDDLAGELKNIAERNQSTLEEVRNYYETQNLIPSLRLDLMEKKVRQFLRESAKIKG